MRKGTFKNTSNPLSTLFTNCFFTAVNNPVTIIAFVFFQKVKQGTSEWDSNGYFEPTGFYFMLR